MWSWIRHLFNADVAAPAVASARLAAAPAAAAPPSAAPPPELADLEPQFFGWLLNSTVTVTASLVAHELRALAHLDQLVADHEAHKRLLPRTASVVPQLLARLRGDSTPLVELTAQVSRDVTLVAEVIRLANSPVYRRHEAVVELGHAVRLLGAEGLRRAIARAVLQPLINVRGSAFISQCAQRLWSHADKKSQLCAAMAKAQGLDAFEGYLLGLAHNAAWTATLRGVDASQPGATWRSSRAFAAELGTRRDRLFALIARQWQLSEPLQQLANSVALQGLAGTGSAQGRLLFLGDQLASMMCAGADAAAIDSVLQAQAFGVRECYAQLTQAQAQTEAPAAPDTQPSKCSPAAAQTTSSTQMAST
jgi:HD-like signal output (HDOD) protein